MTAETFLAWWPVVVAVATIIAAGGAGRYALKIVVARLDTLAVELKETNKQLTSVSTTVAVQAATLVAHTEQDRIQFQNIHAQLTGRIGA
jgi:hypothetical protein